MGRIRLVSLLIICLLLTGCLLRGGPATLSDLEVAYNEAQDALAEAESIGAKEEKPRLVEMAKNRLEEVRENQLGAPSHDVLREYRYVKTLAQRAVNKTLKNRMNQLGQEMDSLEHSSPDTVIRKVPRQPADTSPPDIIIRKVPRQPADTSPPDTIVPEALRQPTDIPSPDTIFRKVPRQPADISPDPILRQAPRESENTSPEPFIQSKPQLRN